MRRALPFAFLSLFLLCPSLAFGQGGNDKAAEVLAITKAGKGIVLLAGDIALEAGKLAKGSQWTFFVQLPKAKADALRKELDRDGLLGNRDYVQDGVASLYLSDDLADAVIVSESPGTTVPGLSEVLRVLRPEGKGLVGNKIVTKQFAKGTDEWSHPYRAPDNNPQ